MSMAGCSASDLTRAGSRSRSVFEQDGNQTIMDPETRVNRYAVLDTDAARGATSIKVNTPGNGVYLNLTTLAENDLLLIIQMQGADIELGADKDDPKFGEVKSPEGAGLFEFVRVKSVDAGAQTIEIDDSCGGLRNAYSAGGRTQVIRVPQYNVLTVGDTGSIVAEPWDGEIGGVVAIRANTVVLEGNADPNLDLGIIDVSGRGFRGGQSGGDSGDDDIDDYYGDANGVGGEKGEGIGGTQDDYDNAGVRYGRGAIANGGGGGNTFKSGGGGGANAGDIAKWTGHGVMDPNTTGASAWMLDPGRVNNMLATSSGGGRGGYTMSDTDADALTKGPNSGDWGGNERRERGGRGGRPVPNDANGTSTSAARLFLGGGGGAGHDYNSDDGTSAGTGGNGGGLVYLIAGSVNGGKIKANGANGGSPDNDGKAGGGGGGAGGTVVINALTVGNVAIEANGGKGGDQPDTGDDEAEGPGGGGGGGYIALRPGVTVMRSARGGLNGSTEAQALSEFPANGATRGGDGVEMATLATRMDVQPPICAPADLEISITDNRDQSIPGDKITYTVTVTNKGPFDVRGAQVKNTIDLGGASVDSSWRCAVTALSGSTDANTSCGAAQGTGLIDTTVSLLPGGTATFTIEVTVPLSATGQLAHKAEVIPPPSVNDPNTANNSATDTNSVGDAADLQIEIAGRLDGVRAAFTIRVRNNGPAQAKNPKIKIEIPAGTALSRIEGDRSFTCSVVDLDATCTRASLDSGQTAEVTLGFNPLSAIPSAQLGAVVFSDIADGNTTNNQATATVIFDGGPVFGGGGFGCQVGRSGAAGAWMFGLLATLFLLMRRKRA